MKQAIPSKKGIPVIAVDLFPIFKAINSISVKTLARPHVVHYVIVYSIESWWCLDKKWVKKRRENGIPLSYRGRRM